MFQRIFCGAFALMVLIGPVAPSLAGVPAQQEEARQGFVATLLDWLPGSSFLKSLSGVSGGPGPAEPASGPVSQTSLVDLPKEDPEGEIGPQIDPNG